MSGRDKPVQLPLGADRGRRREGAGDGGGREPRVYTVAQLVRLACRCVEKYFPGVTVEGEVSNLTTPSSGHLYFTLKDRQAQLSVVIFRSAARRLKFKLEHGQSLRLRGKLTIYEAQGRFQLTAEHAEPVGLGAAQLAFEQLKRKLQAEGLFDPAHKKPLPFLPRKIAVVTSRSGAAWRDILRVLAGRCPVHVVLCPALVQGSEAPYDIATALRRADRIGADLLIVGRGGGSLEDLQAFNNEQVARTIHKLRTPVISAVGHEIDVTIADMVADRRVPTPSAAAEQAVPVMGELRQTIADLRGRAGRAALQQQRRQALALERARRRLGTPVGLLDRGRMQLDDLVGRLQGALRLERSRRLLDQLGARLQAQRPRARLERDRSLLRQTEADLEAAMRRRLEERKTRLARSAAALEAMSPLKVLSRGYSLVQDERGGVVRDAAEVEVGDRLEILLHRGRLECRVEGRDEEGADE